MRKGARLSEVVGAGVAMSTCGEYATIANSSPPAPWRSRVYREAAFGWSLCEVSPAAKGLAGYSALRVSGNHAEGCVSHDFDCLFFNQQP